MTTRLTGPLAWGTCRCRGVRSAPGKRRSFSKSSVTREELTGYKHWRDAAAGTFDTLPLKPFPLAASRDLIPRNDQRGTQTAPFLPRNGTNSAVRQYSALNGVECPATMRKSRGSKRKELHSNDIERICHHHDNCRNQHSTEDATPTRKSHGEEFGYSNMQLRFTQPRTRSRKSSPTRASTNSRAPRKPPSARPSPN